MLVFLCELPAFLSIAHHYLEIELGNIHRLQSHTEYLDVPLGNNSSFPFLSNSGKDSSRKMFSPFLPPLILTNDVLEQCTRAREPVIYPNGTFILKEASFIR